MMSYLDRIKIRAADYITFEEIYESDSQYQQFLNFASDLIYKFAKKFNITEDKMLDIFINSLKKEI